jgi:P pilus assembly chaperone PapD
MKPTAFMRCIEGVLGAALACAATSAAAQGFAAAVTPPRFEVTGNAGQTARHVVEIINAGATPATYNVRTADWSLSEEAAVTFYDTLQPGSCRPWVAIERPKVSVSAGGRVRYRFEVTPPAGTPAAECRFALLIEGEEPAMAQMGSFSIPVSGRIGVIVYVAVGDAAPKLELIAAETANINGKPTPSLRVRNTGNAHGRISGFLTGTDATGHELEFTPSTFPVLPGETRLLALGAQDARDQSVTPLLPVTVRGTLEWGSVKQEFEHRFEALVRGSTPATPPPPTSAVTPGRR